MHNVHPSSLPAPDQDVKALKSVSNSLRGGTSHFQTSSDGNKKIDEAHSVVLKDVKGMFKTSHFSPSAFSLVSLTLYHASPFEDEYQDGNAKGAEAALSPSLGDSEGMAVAPVDQPLPQSPEAFTMSSLFPKDLMDKVSEVKDKIQNEYIGSLKEQILDSEIGDAYYEFLNSTGDVWELAADFMEPITSVFSNDTTSDSFFDSVAGLLSNQSDTIMSKFNGLQTCSADGGRGVHKAETFQEWIEGESFARKEDLAVKEEFNSPWKPLCGLLYGLGEAFNVLGNFNGTYFKNYENTWSDCGSIGVTILPRKSILNTFCEALAHVPILLSLRTNSQFKASIRIPRQPNKWNLHVDAGVGMEFNWNLPGEINDGWPTHEKRWQIDIADLEPSNHVGFLKTTFLAGFMVGYDWDSLCQPGQYVNDRKVCTTCPNVSSLFFSGRSNMIYCAKFQTFVLALK